MTTRPTYYGDLTDAQQEQVERHLLAICHLMGMPEGAVDGLIDSLDQAAEICGATSQDSDGEDDDAE